MTALLTALVGTANAQEKAATATSGEQRGLEHVEKRNAELTELLGLTPEQSAAVLAINKEHITGMARARNSGLTGEALREELKKVNKKHDDDLRATLTEEQYNKLPNPRKVQQRTVAAPEQKSE